MQPNGQLIAATLIPNIGGWTIGFYTKKDVKEWYHTLNKPKWTPPNWIFGPVWTGIYSSIGYASYIVYTEGGGCQGGNGRLPLILYGSNLCLNWAWSLIFFKAKNIKLALYEIALVDLSAAVTGFLFYKVNNTAGLIFIPYVAWLGFASFLNYSFLKANQK